MTTVARERNELRMDVKFFQVPNAIFDMENDLTPVQKLVWVYICRRGNQGTTAFPSYRRIAKDCNVGRRTAMRAVQVLVEKKWLEKTTRHHGEYSTNIYHVKIRGGVTESPPSATSVTPLVSPVSPKEEPLRKNPIERTEEEEGEGENNHHASVVTFFQENINMRVTPVIERELRDLVEDFSPERVATAIAAAALHPPDSPLPYIRKVLENERGKEREKGSAEEKEKDGVIWGSSKNVRLARDEVVKLVQQFGKVGTEDRVERLSLHKASTGRQYLSDYATILKWEGNEFAEKDTAVPRDWEINDVWLAQLMVPVPAGEIKKSPSAPKTGGWQGPRPRTPITCTRCGRLFNAVIPKSRPPVSVCQKCRRAESEQLAAMEAPSKALIGLASDEVIIRGGIRKAVSFDQLTAKEQRTLELRFGLKDGECRTQRDTAKELDVCAQRARELEVHALDKLYGDRLSLEERRKQFAEDSSRRASADGFPGGINVDSRD